jgi:hypothetical protein
MLGEHTRMGMGLTEEQLFASENPLAAIAEQATSAKAYDYLASALGIIQERIEGMRAAYARRDAKDEINQTARASFVNEEEEAPVETPESLRKEAAEQRQKADTAGNPKPGNKADYKAAGFHQGEAERLEKAASELEEKLKAVDREIVQEELSAPEQVSTTDLAIAERDTPHGGPGLAECGVKVTEILVETPESLEAEALKLDEEEETSSKAKKYALAGSFQARAKAKRERAAQLRAEAERKKAQAATAQAPAPAPQPAAPVESERKKRKREKREAATQPQAEAPPNGTPASPAALPAAAEADAALSPSSETSPLRALAMRFARGEIDKAGYDEMKALLS